MANFRDSDALTPAASDGKVKTGMSSGERCHQVAHIAADEVGVEQEVVADLKICR